MFFTLSKHATDLVNWSCAALCVPPMNGFPAKESRRYISWLLLALAEFANVLGKPRQSSPRRREGDGTAVSVRSGCTPWRVHKFSRAAEHRRLS